MISDARPVEMWSVERLSREADLIVVATPVEVELTDEKVIYREESPRCEVTLTRFRPEAVLKGKLKAETLRLRHLRKEEIPKPRTSSEYAEYFATAYDRLPNFVKFDPADDAAYLLFLRKTPSGEYVSVSGQVDPGFGIERADLPERGQPWVYSWWKTRIVLMGGTSRIKDLAEAVGVGSRRLGR